MNSTRKCVTDLFIDRLNYSGFRYYRVDNSLSMINGKAVKTTQRRIIPCIRKTGLNVDVREFSEVEIIDCLFDFVIDGYNGRLGNLKDDFLVVVGKVDLVLTDKKPYAYLLCSYKLLHNSEVMPEITGGYYKEALPIMKSLIDSGTNPEDAPALAIKLVKELKDKSSK